MQVEVSDDGRSLLTSARNGQLITWDLTPATGFGTTYPGLGRHWVSNRFEVIDPGGSWWRRTRTLADRPARPMGRRPGPARTA